MTDERSDKLRVLLVEDAWVNQQAATRMLAKLGISPRLATNGREALDALDADHWDLVLMDCEMPVMDGYEATALIRESTGEARDVPIVAMTAHLGPEEERKCREVGMNDFLAKPLRLESLRRVIDGLV